MANYPVYGLVVLRNLGDGKLGPPELYENGYGSYSLAVADLDGDGYPDAALGNWGDLRRVDVFRNTGDGAFLAPEPYFDEGAWEIAAADLDGDGRTDLALASSAGLGVHLLWNTGESLLQAGLSPSPITPDDLALGDVDGDGRLDVVGVERARGKLAMLHGGGDGTFAPVQLVDVPGATRVAVRDLDGDGYADVICGTSSDTDAALRVYRSDGGTLVPLQQLTGLSPYALAFADLDGDGVQDLVSQGGANLVWLRGRGDGTFEGPAVIGPTLSDGIGRTAAADLDGNGWPDVIGISLFGSIHVWLNLGGGSFVHSSVETAVAWEDLALGDLDGDGNPDVVLASYLDQGLGLLLGAGDGTFVATPFVPYYYGVFRIAVGASAGRTQNLVFVRGSMSEDVGVFAVGSGHTLSLLGRWTTRGGFGGGLPLAVGDVDGDLRPDIVAGAIDGIAVRTSACLP